MRSLININHLFLAIVAGLITPWPAHASLNLTTVTFPLTEFEAVAALILAALAAVWLINKIFMITTGRFPITSKFVPGDYVRYHWSPTPLEPSGRFSDRGSFPALVHSVAPDRVVIDSDYFTGPWRQSVHPGNLSSITEREYLDELFNSKKR